MKLVILSSLLLISLCSFTQDSQTAKDTSKAQRNLEAAIIVSQAFNTGDISKIDSLVATDYIDHSERGEVNRDSLKSMIVTMHQQTPDVKTEIIKKAYDDDYVFLLVHSSGKVDKRMGVLNNFIDLTNVEVLRFKDFKIVEHWSYLNMKDVINILSQNK